MILLQYNNPEADHQDIRLAAAGREPLRHGATYLVDDDVAAVLLTRPEWLAVDSDEPEADEPETPGTWDDVSGIGPELAQALALGLGITSRDQLRNELAQYNTTRIIQIPGIGPARAARLVDFAKE